jgi:manganese/zinc/iron transport system permease protein
MGVVVTISLLAAPNRGLLWQWWRSRRTARRLKRETVLLDLYRLARKHGDLSYPHAASVLDTMNARAGHTRRALRRLAGDGLVERDDPHGWYLTAAGIDRARHLAGERDLAMPEAPPSETT